ncbi:hypothetical protein J2S00_001772 [Caldalkalibacillus uzonensis]|uniref:ABC transporter substrate-binding protein n=1 Tax=Caldalkalibacillus uzonensis TaxID=353224 RepID=A0ABU0CSW0_9BACI|nr:hypothetical protein [Caldalkalibacillus uzonensis]MDQ0338986.1 hypothetical protein [Caldalkalibacillus uzonensis]
MNKHADHVQQEMEMGDEAFGSQIEETWQETADWLLEGGLIEAVPSVEEIYVNLVDENNQ